MNKFRSVYDGARVPSFADCGDEVVTKQEFKKECDINHIMDKYARLGVLPVVADGSAMYGDFSAVGDLLEAQAVVEHAERLFNALPSKVRERFKNDPVEALAFVSREANRAEAIELGMIVPPVPVDVPDKKEVSAPAEKKV